MVAAGWGVPAPESLPGPLPGREWPEVKGQLTGWQRIRRWWYGGCRMRIGTPSLFPAFSQCERTAFQDGGA